MKKIFLIILLCTIFLIGYNVLSSTEQKNELQNETLEQKNELENGTYIVKPSSLFDTDELKKLEPHLDMTSGCVEIGYKGDKRNIGIKYEIWEKGKLKNTYKILTLGMPNKFNNIEEDEYNDTISISLKDIILDDLSRSTKTIMTTVVGGSCTKMIIDRYPQYYSSSPYNLISSIVSNDNEEVTVWGLMAMDNRNSGYSHKETIKDTVKIVDWALILKVYFQD